MLRHLLQNVGVNYINKNYWKVVTSKFEIYSKECGYTAMLGLYNIGSCPSIQIRIKAFGGFKKQTKAIYNESKNSRDNSNKTIVELVVVKN